MGDISRALSAAQSQVRAARTALDRMLCSGTPGETLAASQRLRLANEEMKVVGDAMRVRSRAQRKGDKLSRNQRLILTLESRIEVLEEGIRFLRMGVELAETEGSLDDWVDDARDYLADPRVLGTGS